MNAYNIPAGELNHFLYTQCYHQLCTAVSKSLNRPVKSIVHQNQICVEVDRDSVFYTFNARVEYLSEEADILRLVCRITFDDKSYGFSLIRACRDACPELHRYGVITDQHLIPKLHNEKIREKEAERFLLTCFHGESSF